MQSFNISDIQVLTNTGLLFMVYGVISTAYMSYGLRHLPKPVTKKQDFENMLKKEQNIRKERVQSGKVAKQRLDEAIQSQKTNERYYTTDSRLTVGTSNSVGNSGKYNKEEKYSEVIRLSKLGVPLNEISKELNMGISEINLLLTLDNRK